MLIFAFILGAIALILQGILIPRIAIFAFAPFLALATLRCELMRALTLSALAGAALDLLSDGPMGLHALNAILTTAILFRIRRRFSHNDPLHLSFFSGLVSALSTVLQLILLFLFDRRVPFGGKWAFADFIGMPAIDALYAFVWFVAPLSLADKLRRMWVLFWLKRKNLSPMSH